MRMLPYFENALCIYIDPEIFFPKRKGSYVEQKAMQICGRCLERTSCRDFALNDPEITHGVWAGLNIHIVKQENNG